MIIDMEKNDYPLALADLEAGAWYENDLGALVHVIHVIQSGAAEAKGVVWRNRNGSERGNYGSLASGMSYRKVTVERIVVKPCK